MTDLVKRLRERYVHYAEEPERWGMLLEAADRIEQLEADLETERILLRAAKERNTDLEIALERIARFQPGTLAKEIANTAIRERGKG